MLERYMVGATHASPLLIPEGADPVGSILTQVPL